MKLLVAVALVLVAFTGTGVVLARTPEGQVFAMGANGLGLSLLLMVLQAPDVAFAELIIGAVALPLMFFAVLASTKMDRQPRASAGIEDEVESAEP